MSLEQFGSWYIPGNHLEDIGKKLDSVGMTRNRSLRLKRSFRKYSASDQQVTLTYSKSREETRVSLRATDSERAVQVNQMIDNYATTHQQPNGETTTQAA